jgi:hypothetical protein
MNQFPFCNLLSPSSISTTPLLSRLLPSDFFAFCDRRRGGKNQRSSIVGVVVPASWLGCKESEIARGPTVQELPGSKEWQREGRLARGLGSISSRPSPVGQIALVSRSLQPTPPPPPPPSPSLQSPRRTSFGGCKTEKSSLFFPPSQNTNALPRHRLLVREGRACRLQRQEGGGGKGKLARAAGSEGKGRRTR